MEDCMTVADLLQELVLLVPKMKIVVPEAPYNQPNYLTRIGVVILKEKDKDTGVEAGEYIGLNMGMDLDDDTWEDEEDNVTVEENPLVEEVDTSIEANNFEEFTDKLFSTIFPSDTKE